MSQQWQTGVLENKVTLGELNLKPKKTHYLISHYTSSTTSSSPQRYI